MVMGIAANGWNGGLVARVGGSVRQQSFQVEGRWGIVTHLTGFTMRTLLAGLLLLVPSVAAAESGIEAGLSVGGHVFSSDTELGVADAADQPGPKSSYMMGARLGFVLAQRFALEAEAVLIPTKSEMGGSATVLGFRGQARLNLLTGPFRPFVVAGYGGMAIRTTAAQIQNDSDQAYHWGVGFGLALSGSLDLRLDLRHLVVPDRTAAGATSDFEASTGLSYRFGGSEKRASRQRVDVVADGRERVEEVKRPPQELEPKHGDSDGDGVEDEEDRCQGQAEDRDGFQDGDGCADLDNDGDGIVDTADQCPDEPETKNGHLDDDGCPDQVSTDLVGFTFPRNSDKFDPASAALLERAYQVLDRNRRLTVEIAGHCSDGETKPLELSIARAEAVKEYLVRRGIAEERLRTVGYGADRPTASNATKNGRDKNRRIEFRLVRPDE
jgi:OOP family OmpA-OmpF porin